MSGAAATRPDELDRVAAAVDRAALGLGRVQTGAAFAYHTKDLEKLPGVVREAREAKQAADNALALLLAMGAARPGQGAAPAATVANDALRLDQLDTPAARRFLAVLEAAAAAGAELDRERGWVDDAGEPVGHGETLAAMAYRVRTEVHGPAGRE